METNPSTFHFQLAIDGVKNMDKEVKERSKYTLIHCLEEVNKNGSNDAA